MHMLMLCLLLDALGSILTFYICFCLIPRRRSRGTKCGRQWQYTASNFVLSHKFTHRQNKSRCIVLIERPISSVPFFTWFFTTHFPTDAVTFQCNNASLQFALAEQIRKKRPCECQKGSELALHIWANLFCLSGTRTWWVGSTTETVAWFLHHTHQPTSPIIISEWNFRSLSSTAHVDRTFPLLTYQTGHIWSVNPMHFQIIFHNALNWPKWYSKHVNNVTNNTSSIFKEKLLHSLFFFYSFTVHVAITHIKNQLMHD
jgi:hypothetical protein